MEPLTPAKLTPPRPGPGLHFVDTGAEKNSVGGVDGPATVQYETRYAQEETFKAPWSACEGRKDKNVQNSPIGTGPVLSPSEKKDSRKRHNDGIDLNKKPKQRRRMKKHRPKILDNVTPKKVPKAKTPQSSTLKCKTPKPPKTPEPVIRGKRKNTTPNPRTPNPATPDRVQEKRTYTRKNDFTHSTNCNNDSGVVKYVQAAFKCPQVASRSCKRSLGFDFQAIDQDHPQSVDQDYLVPKSCQQGPSFNFDPRAGYEFFWKIRTSKRNTCRKNKYAKKKFEALEDLLEDVENQLDDMLIIENRGKIVYQYQRRRKSCLSPIDNNVFVKGDHHADEKSLVLTEDLHSSLKVYRRTFGEDRCQRNSRLIGPNFPSMWKKRRLRRKKLQFLRRCLLLRARKDDIRYVNSASVKFKQRIRKSALRLKQESSVHTQVKKSRFDNAVAGSDFYVEKSFIHMISPTHRQACAAMINPEFFKCLLSLNPIAKSRKKRSKVPIHRRKNMMEFSVNECLFQQIVECNPLQEVPIKEIERFSTDDQDLRIENGDVDKGVSNLIGRMNSLDIHRECNEFMVQCQNVNRGLVDAIVRYDDVNKALVEPSKKRKVPQKVALDKETLRVWRLLLVNDGSETAEEESDKCREEYLEKQREIFCGRVESFIAKMHLIQGNRRFSPWKGSVVDSVVGVFLTQNVSDHLSSSAFMDLAARYPVKFRNGGVDDHAEPPSSQEFVGYYSGAYEQLLNCDCKEVEQNMIIPCATTSVETLVTEPEQVDVLDAFPLQDKPCGDGSPYTFRELLALEQDAYLKQFYDVPNGNLLSHEGAVNEDLTASWGKNEKRFSGMPCFDGTCAIASLLPNMGLFEPSQVYSKIELEVVGEKNESNGPLKHLECGSLVQQKETSEEKEGGPVCCLQSEAAVKERLDAENNHHDGREKNSNNEASPRKKRTKLDRREKTSNTEVSPGKKKTKLKVKQEKKIDWEELRRTYCKFGERETNGNNRDSVDWQAVMKATKEEISEIIKARGMSNVLAKRIRACLKRLVNNHGSIDLEWLRDIPPDKAKEFLLSIKGLGLKSVECVRLLTLHHLAFPVDTNVARVVVRLGWVPLKPLPESLQIHLLDLYPMMDAIQKYLFPRLGNLDQLTLYELHYQMITFGKVFCTKIKPNCNACPMRAECKHYASAFASARLALPGPNKKSNDQNQPGLNEESTTIPMVSAIVDQNRFMLSTSPSLLKINEPSLSCHDVQNCDPIIEVPSSPEPELEEPESEEIPHKNLNCEDIEDYFCDSNDEISTIKLNTEELKEKLRNIIEENNLFLEENDKSRALVALTAEAASARPAPMPTKYIQKQRTLHNVYELPDSHPLLANFERRDPDDPCAYLLAIWPPGETCKSSEHMEEGSNSCNRIGKATVKGSILIPCRTANRGSFPLNGTYFQVNEVFADDESSHNPIDVRMDWIWNLSRRGLCCGTSATSIFKGLSTDDIQRCFWNGFICVRGFNTKTRKPRRLHRRFHVSTTAVAKEKRKATHQSI